MPIDTGITEQTIGETLQRLRLENKLSLRTLASTTGFSPSFLSQIENGHSSPSIASLDRIATALGFTLSGFFEEVMPDTPAVIRAADRKTIRSGWSKTKFSPLAPEGTLQRLQGLLITVEPGGRSGKNLSSNETEQIVFVVEGEIELTLGVESTVLNAWDSATIPAGYDHRWENRSDGTVHMIVISTRRRG